ncbi:CdaR family transcriptional regulator [Oceanobacillus neutriphilus]|uniref:XRE family transcriptional regulator n=1 Tax=Oceanobacillus neutriphilus TaxID=531815 RepID=A0ABQ2NZW1_9BACI|nr:sugar diacid recognition domain-containing protein [Oceanobacillus neutriphilus]GGP14725.1 XRE family transcriptional regulator [Oceanobacillus neutriphilus]
MNMLTKEIANAIVRETSLRLKRNVNIMDIDGVIIATQDTERLNTVHEGAVKVLKNGEALAIYPDQGEVWEGSEPGINLPITFHDNIIGVIGITGNPDEMKHIGELVKMTTELMIDQEFITSQLEWKQRTKEMIIDQLIKTSSSQKAIQQGLDMLKMELTPPFMAFVIQIGNLTIQKQELIQKIESLLDKQPAIAGFINLNQLFIAAPEFEEAEALRKIKTMQELFHKLHIKFRIAYSLPFHKLNQFHQAYSECELALKISDPETEIISFSQIEVRALLYQLDQTLREKFSKRILKNFDEMQAITLKAFFANDLNIQKTADVLFLHRNTLLYRINKITSETGYNPRIFNDALILQVALWINEQNK